jgi:hypothetical protein
MANWYGVTVDGKYVTDETAIVDGFLSEDATVALRLRDADAREVANVLKTFVYGEVEIVTLPEDI